MYKPYLRPKLTFKPSFMTACQRHSGLHRKSYGHPYCNRERRSVKHLTEHALSESEIGKLLEAALCSPTSFNMQNWRFVLVTEPAKKALRAAA